MRMKNLSAEMARHRVSNADIRKLLLCSDKTVRNKLSGATKFSVCEAIKIRDTFFPSMSIKYLFAQDFDMDTDDRHNGT